MKLLKILQQRFDFPAFEALTRLFDAVKADPERLARVLVGIDAGLREGQPFRDRSELIGARQLRKRPAPALRQEPLGHSGWNPPDLLEDARMQAQQTEDVRNADRAES